MEERGEAYYEEKIVFSSVYFKSFPARSLKIITNEQDQFLPGYFIVQSKLKKKTE